MSSVVQPIVWANDHLSLLDQRVLTQALARQLGLPTIDLRRERPTDEALAIGLVDRLVPADQVTKLRMALAQDNLPAAGVGYEIFDKSDALGTTSFIQNINNLRALEGELARTIRGLDRVAAARV